VQFIHESVRDFLLKEGGLKKLWADLGDNFDGESHESLKLCCVHYLERIKVPLNKLTIGILLDNPLLEYAAEYVLSHADAAASSGISQRPFSATSRAPFGFLPITSCSK
jgi:hypothetical protein